MNQSCSDSDVSLSPSQLLERLQMLRQLQLLQRGKLQKQRLQYNETSETNANTSSITEIISHFTNSNNSTSYNTFRSLLLSPSSVESPRLNTSNISQKVNDRDLIDGVSVLNLSQESEFIANSPASINRAASKNESNTETLNNEAVAGTTDNSAVNKMSNKKILLDDMPILSPKKDFEALLIEKLQMEMSKEVVSPKKTTNLNTKKPFLKRGEGMARFGVKKNDLVIVNTKSLPWRRKNNNKSIQSPVKLIKATQKNIQCEDKLDVEILVTDQKFTKMKKTESKPQQKIKVLQQHSKKETNNNNIGQSEADTSIINFKNKADKIIQMPKGEHPKLETRGKTWAAVLNNEQSDFLSKLKQSEYYKNFASPTKSIVSNMSCDENASELRQQKEAAEQNLFDLLENKVSHDSFNIENSFFNRFLKRHNLECSGESTPLVLQKCLANNPNLMHIFPDVNYKQKNSYQETESAYTECCSDTCSSVSSCCSCKTIEPATPQTCNNETKNAVKNKKEVPTETINDKNNQNEEVEAMKANMVEMNTKLITTSELLKERLWELESEIETFRKENANLSKLREEVDMERQKFYEDKNNFEQKFNEEKILSEYYLAEEKEKLNKQKQMYERYVREMRGRLNKKEKDEVINLKQEISNLKEEIRVKDAKSTSNIARLRNHIKIMEKEKTDLQKELEKAKKENRRLQHSNDITRRMTNMKYLEQINKKLTNINKDTHSEVELSNDTKYKTFEIERQSRNRNRKVIENAIRPRAKSVPNLKVTSRYAKYFSQKDAFSEMGKKGTLNVEKINLNWDSENSDLNTDDNESAKEVNSDNESENNLEKIYLETFRSTSPKKKSADSNNTCNEFFLRKSNSVSSRDSKSPIMSVSQNSSNRFREETKTPTPVNHQSFQRSSNYSSDSNLVKSPVPILNHRPSNNKAQYHPNSNRSISPSILSNHSSLKSTVIPNDAYRDKLSVSPEPSSSKTSLMKTSLNPTEIRKHDGSRELRYPNGNVKYIATDGKYTKFLYYNGDVKENFLSEGRIKYYYAETKTYHTTHADGLEVLEFPDGQVEKRYKDGSSEVCLPNGSIRYHDPKNEHVREEWRFPDGAALTISATGEQRIAFSNGQVEVHATDHKRREFPDGTVKLVYKDGTSETRYASGRVRIKDKHGNLIMDSAS